jgi:hypothetical protein
MTDPFNQLPTDPEWLRKIDKHSEAANADLGCMVVMIAVQENGKLCASFAGVPETGPLKSCESMASPACHRGHVERSIRKIEGPAMTEVCYRCNEPILPDEPMEFHYGSAGGYAHWECAARAVIGGANHLLGRCTCCGGTEPPDDPTLSKREQARTALGIFRAQQVQRGPDFFPPDFDENT